MTNYYSLIVYDLWGNPKDGFEVNNAYVAERDIVLSDDSLSTDKKLVSALRRLNLIKKGTHAKSLDIDGEDTHALYFTDRRKSVGGFCPAFELLRQKHNSQGRESHDNCL